MNKFFLKPSLFLIFFMILSQPVFSGEFLVRDATVVIDADYDPWEGSSKWEFDGAGPDNWLSPDDYYNGTFYFRFEIISQPTDRACAAQFVIWQDWNYPTSWLEQASPHTFLYGPGSIAYASGTPASWWQYNDNPLDFSRPSDFWKLGIMLWSADPFGMIAIYKANQPQVDIHDEIWADRHDWFPMSFRYTVVAVSAGSTFSGDWDYYMGNTPSGVQPAYTIDYSNERTNEAILTQHEYSYNNSTWYDGTGVKLALSPSSIVYFRDKNDNYLTQTLIVPARPATPSFVIDYSAEQTAGTVSSAYQYSTASDMSGATAGAGAKLDLTPGTDLYFIQAATASSFRSAMQTLDVPARPAAPVFTIDFVNEATLEAVSAGIVYSLTSDMSNSTAGAGSSLPVTPGTDYYFRLTATSSAFASSVSQLEVPDRPGNPAYTINFGLEATGEAVPATVVYADNPAFSGYQSGSDAPLALTPGDTLYFRTAATSSNFESSSFMLPSPERPLLSSSSSSPTQDNPIVVNLSFGYETGTLELAKLEVGNAGILDVTGAYAISLVPETAGTVLLRVAADAVPEGNFSSELFSIVYEEMPDLLESIGNSSWELYPNPTKGIIYLRGTNQTQEPVRILLLDKLGRVIREEKPDYGIQSLDLTGMLPGIYLLILEHERGMEMFKVSLVEE
ncbi:MAG: T9SS type A sorting domain-containing protein [Bacteroidales bacterium]|nr:T9SS type A sorting domain-containing protein [Bacteroidales bacterium]